ncbi:MAG: hypothetical protein ACI31A_04630 [Candidatus Limisoma sp.]
MNKFKYTTILLAASALLGACAQDDYDFAGAGEPVEIGNVSFAGYASADTRFVEDEDYGKSILFSEGDILYLRKTYSDVVGEYQYTNGSVKSVKPLYWDSKTVFDYHIYTFAPQSFITDNHFDLTDQSTNLAYVLNTTVSVEYPNPIEDIQLRSSLAKLRIRITDGNVDVSSISEVCVKGCPGFKFTNSSITYDSTEDWIKMRRCEYKQAGLVWEACLNSNRQVRTLQMTVDGKTFEVPLDNVIQLQDGRLHTVDVTLVSGYDRWINLATLTETYVINDSGKYYFYGTGSYGVSVESGSPEVTFKDAEITTDATAISVAGGGTPTIAFEGTCRVNAGVAINVAAGTLSITNSGNVTLASTTESKGAINLTDEANLNISGGVFTLSNSSGWSGLYIGETTTPLIGPEYAQTCGDIHITDATINAPNDFIQNPVVGTAADSTCGNITIENSTISCSIQASAAIGTAHSLSSYGSRCGIITLKQCDLNITRGNYYAWVGSVVGCAATMASGGLNSASTYVQSIHIYLKPGQTKDEFLATFDDGREYNLVGCPEESKQPTCVPGGVYWYDSNGNGL